MTCADDATLWRYAKGALDANARANVETHLAGCERCRTAFARVQITRSLVRGAAPACPPVDWKRADDAVMSAATAHFARRARWQMPVWSLAGGLVAVAMAVFAWAPWKSTPSGKESAPPPDVGAVLAEVTIESASGATVQSTNGIAALTAGGEIRTRARIVTDDGGSALVRLPEHSRARLGARTVATLARATREEIEIHLSRGNVVVQAAHVRRKEFLVVTDEVQVRVVGTAFRVARAEGQVTVAVAEGRVLVEPRGGDSRLVDAGRRVVIGPDGAYLESAALRSEDSAAFAELDTTWHPQAADATGPAHAVGSTRREAPTSSEERAPVHPGSQGAVAGAAPAPQNVPVPDPATPAVSAPEDGTTPGLQEPNAAAQPAVAERAHQNGLPVTAEGLFLQRAGEAMKTGRCQNYLLGLQDVSEGSEDMSAREIAVILRARCFDELLKPNEAAAEYRKYLQRFPSGRYAEEARRVLAE